MHIQMVLAPEFMICYYYAFPFLFTSSRDQNNASANASKSSSKLNDPHKNNSVPSQHTSAPSSNYEGDLDDDFDPRGSSSSSKFPELCLIPREFCGAYIYLFR